MDITEAKSICKKLTEINEAIWFSSGSKKEELRTTFRNNYRSVLDAGFLIRRYREDGRPMFKPRVNKHINDVSICSNRPDFVNIKNDCTTRCISFCTGIDYTIIRNEQLTNARATHGMWSWKHDIVWEKSLLTRGYSKLIFKHRRMSRATFLKFSKTLPINDGIIATTSSGHVAAIDMAQRKILDTWNSSGGRIRKLYVPTSQMYAYINWFDSIGYPVSIAN